MSITSIIAIINLCLVVVVGLFNWFAHNKLVGNDLHHLAADVKTLVSRQQIISDQVQSLATDLSFVKGRCELHISKPKNKKKIS